MSDETKRAESDLDKIERILRAMAGRTVDTDREAFTYVLRRRGGSKWEARVAIILDDGSEVPFGAVMHTVTSAVRPSHAVAHLELLVAVRAVAKARAAALTGAVDE